MRGTAALPGSGRLWATVGYALCDNPSLLLVPLQRLVPPKASNAKSDGMAGQRAGVRSVSPPYVIKVPEGAVLRGCKKTRRKLREHLRLRAETHSQLRVIASMFVLRIFLTCLVGYPSPGYLSAPQPPAVQPPQPPDAPPLPVLPPRAPAQPAPAQPASMECDTDSDSESDCDSEPEPQSDSESDSEPEPVTQPPQRRCSARLAALAPAAPTGPPLPLDCEDPLMLRQLKYFCKFFANPNFKTCYNQLQRRHDPSNQALVAKLHELGSINLKGDANTIDAHSMQLAVAMQQHYSNPGKWWWGIAEMREFVFDPDTQIGVGIDPGVTQAVSAASGVWDPQSGQLMADQLRRWKLTKGEVKHASGLNNARRDTERWLAPIKPHLQHLASASSVGTSLEANLKHITVTLATWDAVWEVYLDPKWARQRLRQYGAQDRALEQFFNKLEKGMAELSMKRHNRAKQLVVFFGAATIGTAGGWGADAVLRACRKVVCRPRGTDQLRGRVVLVDEHRTSRVSSAVNGQQPCEEELNTLSATRPAGWKPPAGQVEHRLVRPAWSQERGLPVRGLMWCPVVAPRKPPQAPRSSQATTQPAASEPGPSTPPPAKRSKPAAEPTKGKGKGKAARAKPAPQPGRWLDRDCNAALNMQRIGESKWRPLELCYWPDQGALPAKGKEYPEHGYKRLRDKPPKAQEQQQPAEAQMLAARLVSDAPMETSQILVPVELQHVQPDILEAYVRQRQHQLLQHLLSRLAPDAANAVTQLLSQRPPERGERLALRFKHTCRFLGCTNVECQLCKNNPTKRCPEGDNLDEAYADSTILRSKCEADIYVELFSTVTGQICRSLGDGEVQQREMCQCVLAPVCAQGGQARLPDLSVHDKNDTFHWQGASYSTFRLMGRCPNTEIQPAISHKFVVSWACMGRVVKTQRALNDYRKSEWVVANAKSQVGMRAPLNKYPHYKDELTRLKYIGSITAQRLRDVQAHLDCNVPFTCIETVEQMKHLMMFADTNRLVENKLLELLNFRGKHKHKWDYLRATLNHIVYDDNAHRAWLLPEGGSDPGSLGLLFTCRQGQVNLDKPAGVCQRRPFLKLTAWRRSAEQAWLTPGHPGWSIAQDPMEFVSSSGGLGAPGSVSPALSGHDAMDDSQACLMRRTSAASSPLPRLVNPLAAMQLSLGLRAGAGLLGGSTNSDPAACTGSEAATAPHHSRSSSLRRVGSVRSNGYAGSDGLQYTVSEAGMDPMLRHSRVSNGSTGDIQAREHPTGATGYGHGMDAPGPAGLPPLSRSRHLPQSQRSQEGTLAHVFDVDACDPDFLLALDASAFDVKELTSAMQYHGNLNSPGAHFSEALSLGLGLDHGPEQHGVPGLLGSAGQHMQHAVQQASNSGSVPGLEPGPGLQPREMSFAHFAMGQSAPDPGRATTGAPFHQFPLSDSFTQTLRRMMHHFDAEACKPEHTMHPGDGTPAA
ncbi:hypothetical protein QJQ45_020508 [Haematococcus lacustris]|nr:hypothetical protein QJQ45_020508 [Haematococcus lacustris]